MLRTYEIIKWRLSVILGEKSEATSVLQLTIYLMESKGDLFDTHQTALAQTAGKIKAWQRCRNTLELQLKIGLRSCGQSESA